MKNAKKMPVDIVPCKQRGRGERVGVNENETTLLLSANYCHIRVRSTEAELIYAAATVDMRAKSCVRMNIL